MPLLPAYGRDYTSAAKAEAAFRGGVDFKTPARGYTSCRDFKLGSKITIRYNAMANTTIFTMWSMITFIPIGGGLSPKGDSMDFSQLKKMNISLRSEGRRNGQSYTSAEKTLAEQILKTVLTVTNHKIFEEDECFTEHICETLATIIEEKTWDVPSLCRAIYKIHEAEKLQDSESIVDFPKIKNNERVPRDFTSVNLLFRKAMKECGFSQEEIEGTFPSYYKKQQKA